MRQTIRIKLLTIFATAFIGILIPLSVTGQTSSADDSRAIALASTGVISIPTSRPASDDVCEQRLLKALDALEKAEKALGAAVNEIAARKTLDALKDELLKAKDQYIADVMADNDFLRKDRAGKTKSKIRKIFETLEKIALIGLGAYLAK